MTNASVNKIGGSDGWKTVIRFMKNEFILRKLESDAAFFFENETSNIVAINGGRYLNMLQEFLWHQLKDINLDELYIQQDNATCHIADF